MAKRFVGFLKKLKGETNLKNGETLASNTKAELMSKIEQLKDKMPSIQNGIDAVKGVPGKIPDELLKNKIRDVISRYEKFTGVDEIMVLQKTVVEAQDKFIQAQDRRREAGTKLLNIQRRIKEIHEEMQNTSKGDQKYLKLITDEHNTIVEEQHLRKEFGAIEREEREHFGTMSAAVKLSHERERAHADRNKYWYIVASLIGTGFGVLGSTLNNRIKMAEFRDLLTEQMEHSKSVLMTVGQGGQGGYTMGPPGGIQSQQGVDLSKQGQQLRDVEMRVAAIASNQGTILDHMRKSEKNVNIQLEDIKRLIIASTATSAKSDKQLKDAIKKASANSQSISDSNTFMAKIGENEEYLKMTFFVGVVILVIYGIIGKLS